MPDTPPPFPDSEEHLARALQRANLTGDPLGHALALLVRAVRAVRGEAASLREDVAELRAAKAAPPAVSPEAVRDAGKAVAVSAGRHLALAYPWAVGGALALALGVGFGAGWWTAAARPVDTAFGPLAPETVRVLRMNAPVLDRALAEAARSPQPRGGEAAALRVWTRFPEAAGR